MFFNNRLSFFIFLVVIFVFFLKAEESYSSSSSFFRRVGESSFLDIFKIKIALNSINKAGNIAEISDSDLIEIKKIIKNNLLQIESAKLTEKNALLKTISFFKNSNQNDSGLVFLKDLTKYSQLNSRNLKLLRKEIINLFLNNKELRNFSKIWLENYTNSVYKINIEETDYKIISNDFSYILKDSSNLPDIIVTGSCEVIRNRYYIKLEGYSVHTNELLSRVIYSTSKEDIIKNTEENLKNFFSKLFDIQYCYLEIKTKKDYEIYLNNRYVGKEDVYIPYLIPNRYVLSFKKENSEKINKVVDLKPLETKTYIFEEEINEKLQIININIMPENTKIFINSKFVGVTPLQYQLPAGNYILTAKSQSDIHKDYRYTFKIEEIKDTPLQITFELNTVDIKKYINIKKYLYYSSFWSFTFNLALTVPFVIIATQYYNMPQEFSNSYYNLLMDKNNPNYEKYLSDYNKKINELILIADVLRFTSIALSINMGLSLIWLFYSLFDYLIFLDKKDFIPIFNIQYSSNSNEISLYFSIKLKEKI